VNVVCSVPIPWCEALAAAFLKDTGISVNITQKASADALAQVTAEKADPRHDVWYAGSGEAHLQAAETGLTDEYRSPLLAALHPWAVRQAEESKGRSVGIHAAVLGIGYNSKVLATKQLPEPKCWADLAKPEYRGELRMPNPISSPTGYVAVATLVQIFGEDEAFSQLKGIHRNIDEYPRTGNGAIRAAARGETTIGVTYVHDGITEIANGFPIRLAMPCEGTGYEVASMSIIRGARNPRNARRFYDWALTPAAQRIGGEMKNFQVASNRATPVPSATPDLGEPRLIRYDFVRFGAAAERKRLLEKWDRDVHALPR
jgi:iron(III) transport system substrate-binding protein